MMRFQNFINRIQEKPYETRVKIMWWSVIILAIILVLLWAFNIKSTINNSSFSETSSGSKTESTSAPAKETYVSVERAEISGETLNIYFNINNTSNDILNAPKLSNISLTAKDTEYDAYQLTDRQGRPFVQKILSHNQNFGILAFPNVNTDSAELILDNMFFEMTPDQVFIQTIHLDLKDLLKKDSNLRS